MYLLRFSGARDSFGLFLTPEGDIPTHSSADAEIYVEYISDLTRPPSSLRFIPLLDLPSLPKGQGEILNQALSAFWPTLQSPLPRFNSVENYKFSFPIFPSQFYAYGAPCAPMPEDGALFGGSFNPWHEGHYACVELLRRHRPELPIYVIPDYNPQKQRPQFPCYWQQYQFLRHQLASIPNCYVYPGLCGIASPNPTSFWIDTFITRPSFLMGDDTFFSLPSWVNYKKIVATLENLYVVPRLEKYTHAQYEEMKKRIEATPDVSRHPQIHLLPEHPFQNLRSCDIRGTGII